MIRSAFLQQRLLGRFLIPGGNVGSITSLRPGGCRFGSGGMNGFSLHGERPAPTAVEEEKDVPKPPRVIQGEVFKLATDLRTIRTGDILENPYELTVSESMQDFWHSAFHAQDRITTSRPFCRKMGLQDRVLPFSLALFLCSAMTHEDSARIHVGLGSVKYTWPCFAGDTFTKTFTAKSIRNTSDGHHSIIQFQCDLINQRGRLCMRADKRLLCDFAVPESHVEEEEIDIPPHNGNLFRDHLLSKAHVLKGMQSHSLANFKPGQLILHGLKRTLTFGQTQQLASLARLTHERHFDCRKYDSTELLLPGGLVVGTTMSASALDFHEVLHEEVLNINYVNQLHPGNIVGAVSYIKSVEDAVGDLQVVTVRTLGIKNLDVVKDLEGVDLPLELFDTNIERHGGIKARKIQDICKSQCPILHNHVVVQIDRTIVRQVPRHSVFLL